MKRIRKTVFTVTVLSEEGEIPPGQLELETVLSEMDDGPYIGQCTTESEDWLDPVKVQDELLALGNDGTFFDLGEDE